VVITIDILELVDRLETLVNAGWRIPFTVKTAIDESAFFDVIDQMRVSIPQEIKQANELLREREKVLAAAQEEAERILAQAQEKAARLLDEHEILAAARAEAESIKAQAQRDADNTRRGADEYAFSILSELESRLGTLLRTTSNGLAAIKRRQARADSETAEESSKS
jgi:regulator of protease activity HflC (stomatin/prohibitin superfamily)